MAVADLGSALSVPPTGATAPTQRMASSPKRKNNKAGYAFISPVLVGMALWTLLPMILSLVYSFTKYDLPRKPSFTGVGNYSSVLTDPQFYNSLKVTAIYAAISVPLSLLAGLLIAVLLNQRVPGMRLFRTLIYLPAIVPGMAAAVVFKVLLAPSQFGVVNTVLRDLHLRSTPVEFYTNPSTALGSVILLGLWGAGGSMLVWLAGLNSVPADLYEAAKVDGAGAITRFVKITLPVVSPTILFNAVLSIIAAMQIFLQSLFVSAGAGTANAANGSPLGALDFVNVYIYRHAFNFLQMGTGAAAAWLLFILTLAVTLGFFRWSRRWVFYAGGDQ